MKRFPEPPAWLRGGKLVGTSPHLPFWGGSVPQHAAPSRTGVHSYPLGSRKVSLPTVPARREGVWSAQAATGRPRDPLWLVPQWGLRVDPVSGQVGALQCQEQPCRGSQAILLRRRRGYSGPGPLRGRRRLTGGGVTVPETLSFTTVIRNPSPQYTWCFALFRFLVCFCRTNDLNRDVRGHIACISSSAGTLTLGSPSRHVALLQSH